MVLRQLNVDWVVVMKKRYQKNYKIITLPVLVESYREWVERIIGRSLCSQNIEKETGGSMKKNDRGRQNFEGDHPA